MHIYCILCISFWYYIVNFTLFKRVSAFMYTLYLLMYMKVTLIFCSSINESNKPMPIRKIYMYTMFSLYSCNYFCYNRFLHSQKHSPRDIFLLSCYKELHIHSDRTNSCSYFHNLSHRILAIKNPLFKVQNKWRCIWFLFIAYKYIVRNIKIYVEYK